MKQEERQAKGQGKNGHKEKDGLRQAPPGGHRDSLTHLSQDFANLHCLLSCNSLGNKRGTHGLGQMPYSVFLHPGDKVSPPTPWQQIEDQKRTNRLEIYLPSYSESLS